MNVAEEKIPFAENVEALTKEIIEEAEAEVQEILRGVEAKANSMIQETKQNLVSEVKQMFAEVEPKIRKEREIKSTEIQTQTKKEILEAKEERINLVLSRLEKKLLSFTKEPAYISLLESIFTKMLTYLPSTGTFQISLNKSDLKKFTKATITKLNPNPELSFTIAQKEYLKEHGILLTSADQKIILDDSLEKRFNQKLEIIRNKIAKLLVKS